MPKSKRNKDSELQLPFGLPPVLPDLNLQLEEYLWSPHRLPIHDFEKAQKYWPRKTEVDNLYHCDLSPVPTTLQVDRDQTTGKIIGFKEVAVKHVSSTAKNSTSLQRAPGPPEEALRGSATNYPFWPGGFEPPSIEKLPNVEEIDFEKDLLSIPPGFSHGFNFMEENETQVNAPEEKTPTSESLELKKDTPVIDFTSLLHANDELGLWKSNTLSKNIPEVNMKPELTITEEEDNFIFEDTVPVLKISDTPTLMETGPKETEYAVKLDVTKAFENFREKLPEMAHEYPFELDVFQKKAVLCLEEHKSVFVAAHTSAGKTVVAEYAIALSQKHMTRTIYTSPIKALSNQKFRDFKLTFKDVGLLTGDIQINQTASCLIMTTEILRSMLYNGSDVIRDLEWVIFDEVHYINDAERGVVWEEVLIFLPQHVRIIMLSATVPNTMEFADWVGRTRKEKIYVISTPKRPVPLEHYLYTGTGGKSKSEQFLLLDADGNFLQSGYNSAVAAKKDRASKSHQTHGAKTPRQMLNPQAERNMWLGLLDHLNKKDKLPVVAFTLSRNRCDQNSQMLTSLDLTTAAEKSEIHAFIHKCTHRLKGTDKKLPQVIHMQDLLKRGVGVHHSGILPILKEVVEMLFQKGLVKLLFATETFAMGVNMPARTVVFDTIRKHDGMGWRELIPGEYIQMAGRAGRRGLDTTGTVIILCKSDVPEIEILRVMMLGNPTKLESKFRLTYSMILNLFRVKQLRVEDMMKRSFAEVGQQKQFSSKQEKLEHLRTVVSKLKCIECETCSDIEGYYKLCKSYLKRRKEMMLKVLTHPVALKALVPGRVILVNCRGERNIPAALLRVNKGTKVRKYEIMLITPKKEVPTEVNIPLKKNVDKKCEIKENDWKMLLLSSETRPFMPNGSVDHCILEITGESILSITTKQVSFDAEKVTNDYKKRQIPRFRNDPPSKSCQEAIQGLFQLVLDHLSNGFPCLDPATDFNLRDIDTVESLSHLKSDRSLLEGYTCCACPQFEEHLRQTYDNMQVKEEVEDIEMWMSEESLSHFPEYQSRVEVLTQMGFIDYARTVQLKGRVACEMGNHELMITELVLENVLTDLPPAEIAALLSCMVFQQKTSSEPKLTPSLEEGIKKIKAVAEKIGRIQRDCGLLEPVLDFVEQFKFGLVEVVYEWARGVAFSEITKCTDVQEGIIVRCIQRLDETLRDVRDAARIIGEPLLYQKMEEASTAIKRDIVFAASLYTE